MNREERIRRLVHLLLDGATREQIREFLERKPETTRAQLVEWLTALAMPMTFGKYGRQGGGATRCAGGEEDRSSPLSGVLTFPSGHLSRGAVRAGGALHV